MGWDPPDALDGELAWRVLRAQTPQVPPWLVDPPQDPTDRDAWFGWAAAVRGVWLDAGAPLREVDLWWGRLIAIRLARVYPGWPHTGSCAAHGQSRADRRPAAGGAGAAMAARTVAVLEQLAAVEQQRRRRQHRAQQDRSAARKQARKQAQ